VNGRFVRKSIWVGVALAALSPIAYLIGANLVSKHDPVARTGLAYDRSEVIEIAARFAKEKNVDVNGWESYVKTRANNLLLAYYRYKPGPAADRVKRLAPPLSTNVLFRLPDRNQHIEVRVDPDGHVLGYSRKLAETANAVDSGEARSLEIASATLPSLFLPDEQSRMTGPETKEQRTGNSITRNYTWRLPVASLPELEIEYHVSVRDEQVLGETIEEKLPEDMFRENQMFGKFGFRPNQQRISGLNAIHIILYWLVCVVVLIMGIYRFIQRARQRELSYKRITNLTIILAFLFLTVILITDIATYDQALMRSTTLLPIYIVGTISYLFMGLFVAIAYGSGEGDLREGYPGKLTSLDALLTGKLFSRNVASAVVLGVAIGGWGLLLLELVPFLWRNFTAAGKNVESYDFLVGRASWLSPFVILPIDVILTMTIGLLIPLPFIRRRVRRTYLVVMLAVLFSWVAGTGSASYFSPWAGAAMLGLVKAALLLFPFFKFDLLTSLVSLGAPTFVTAVVHFTSQPSSSLNRSGYIALAIGLAFLMCEIYFAFKGKLYHDDEVGPQYARQLAQRLTMQAEVSAAREAQIRLMPPLAANPHGLEIAAECLPAQEVGGDYYEVFPLDESRTGIFMAEGGGQGLASALSIAFAKGYILPKVMGPRHSDDSPLEIVRGLQVQLRKAVSNNAGMGIVFAVIDSSEGTIRYARTGDYPRVYLGRRGEKNTFSPTENESSFFAAHGAVPESFTVASALLDLESGDTVMVFTDGIAQATGRSGDGAAESLWGDIGAKGADPSPEKLQNDLEAILEKAGKRADKAGVAPDDLTALLVRVRKV
jgi:serine phosphatase RsbU (regulator of sigma subunit)